MQERKTEAHSRVDDWPHRPWMLAGLLALSGLLIFAVTDDHPETPGRAAIAAFLFFGAMAAAFTIEEKRWKEPAVFAVIAGLVMGGLAWRAIDTGDHLADEWFGFSAGLVATVLALPLFQAGFHRKRFSTPYPDTHFFVWSDAVSAAGGFVFTGLAWAMFFLLAALFHLLKIDLLRDLIDEPWFAWILSGGAFGASLGILRNHLRIIGTLQSVVMLVLSLLAVPLAVALVLFLLAMIVSGLDVLWEATRNATPILLSCAVGAFVLANAILRDDDSEMSKARPMRIAAGVLALGILPLTAFAAVSMVMRIGQHGLSPERIWALIAIAVSCAYGLAYLVAVIRGWSAGWHDGIRRANLNLAAGVCLLALFLAMPILDFGGISARNQIGRLQSGTVSAAEFDYAALRWDFGDAGRKALEKLARSPDPEVSKLAKETQELEQRPWRGAPHEGPFAERIAHFRTEIEEPDVIDAFETMIRREGWRCAHACTALDLGTISTGSRHFALVESLGVTHFLMDEGGELKTYYPRFVEPAPGPQAPVDLDAERDVEVRTYTGRQVYVDGRPVSQPFP